MSLPKPIVPRVWKAITSKDEMEKWYFNLIDFKAQAGFTVEFEAGSDETKYLHCWKILEVVAERRIRFSWEYPKVKGYSEVTMELSPYGEEATRMKLTHTSLDSFPDLKDFTRQSFEGGWNYIIGESLINYLDKNQTIWK